MSPSAGKRACRPSGATPTQLMPAPQTTATPQPRSLPARSRANVSLPTSSRSAQPPRGGELLERLDLGGQVEAGELQRGGPRGRAAGIQTRRREGLVDEPIDDVERPSKAEVMRRADGPADQREHVAVDTQQREL